MQRQVEQRNGYILIESLFAIILTGMLLTMGFSLVTAGEQLNARTESILAANAAAFAKVQQYENKTFSSIPIGVDTSNYEVEDFSTSLPSITGNLIKHGTAKVYTRYANETTQSLLKMNVVIDFQYGSTTRKIEYGTYIQLGGVGR